MSLSREDFDAIVRLVCPHCRNEHEPFQREDTKEWCHHMSTAVDQRTTSMSHTLCWVSGLRNSRFAPVETVGVQGTADIPSG